MGNHSGNLLKLLMFRFNITFWVQIFRMRNFRAVYFHYLNLHKFKQFEFCQFFKKSQCFWLKFGFTEYFNWKIFLQISQILSFFTKVYLGENLKLFIKFISQSFSCFSLSIFCILKPHVSKKIF